uniref:Uncharacterized protein n=1 Tax=Rhizophora mucronata TaxID=61149 RepID=A0A2P2P9G6_RHIMU
MLPSIESHRSLLEQVVVTFKFSK